MKYRVEWSNGIHVVWTDSWATALLLYRCMPAPSPITSDRHDGERDGLTEDEREEMYS